MMRRAKRALAGAFPNAAQVYRELRVRRRCHPRHLVPTPHGFQLAGNEIMAAPGFERAEVEFVLRALGRARVFVDVGANIGFYACLARQHGARVVAVEPSRENLECLLFNLHANAWGDVEVLPVGLADRIGTLALHGAGTGASLLPGWAGEAGGAGRLIPVSTLDTVLGERFAGDRLLVKIVVEGAELGVVRGAARLLARRPSPLWLVEICLTEHHPRGLNPEFEAVFQTFWREGYQARALLDDGSERPVTSADVTRWAADGRREFGSISYAFERADA
jgi:FkbM family methyltransferase